MSLHNEFASIEPMAKIPGVDSSQKEGKTAMTVEDRVTFRSVILSAENAPAVSRAVQLLNDIGHEVLSAHSSDEAMALLQQDQTDLLVVDISNSSHNREFVNRLTELPASHRPSEVAIF